MCLTSNRNKKEDGFKELSLSNGFGPQGAPHFCGKERTYAKLGRCPPARARAAVVHLSSRFGSGPGPLYRFLFFRTDTLFSSIFLNQHVCSWRHFLAYLFTPVFSNVFFQRKISLHYISFILCDCSEKIIEFVEVLRLRTASEERDSFYPGRRFSTILGTN